MFESVNMHGIIAAFVLILWACYVGVFGASLFEEIYKSNCIALTLPLAVYAYILGCGALVLFIVARVFHNGIKCTKKTNAPTTNSKLCYVAHSMICFLCGVTTALAFANLRAASGSCDTYEPPVSILVIVFMLNTLNGLLSSEQFFQTIEIDIDIDTEVDQFIFTHRSQFPESNPPTYRDEQVQPKID